MMKINKTLAGIELFMAGILLPYMAAFPIFPEIQSADFSQHLSISRDLVHGVVPSISGQLLYYGIEYYLAFSQILFPHANPFAVIRWAMTILTFLSPLLIYLFAKEIFEDAWIAKATALAYTVSGFVWMEMIFISGLYANFYGVLSSLFLAAATFRFQRSFGFQNLSLFVLALLNTLFSHYSTLLVFPPLLAYLAYKRNWLSASILSAPLAAGGILFPNLATGILGFLAPTSNIVSQPTALSASLGTPVMQFLAEEITDYEFVFLIVCVSTFGYLAFKRKDEKMLFVLSWFLLPLLIAPHNSSAWRFAFIALVPGTLMIGWILSKIPRFPLFPNKRNLLFVLLLFVPTFYPSWSSFALSHALQADNLQSQSHVYEALRWIGKNLPVDPVCANEPQAVGRCNHMVSLTDWRFSYSPLFGGPMVLYAPDYQIVWTDPLQAAFFAATHNSTYLIVTRTSTLPCNPGGSFGLRLAANTTVVKRNDRILLSITSARGLNTSARIYDNGAFVTSVGLRNGTGSIIIYYPVQGEHELFLNLGSASTEGLRISVNDERGYSPRVTTVPPDYCTPWRSFNPASLNGWHLAYSNEDVRIWGVLNA